MEGEGEEHSLRRGSRQYIRGGGRGGTQFEVYIYIWRGGGEGRRRRDMRRKRRGRKGVWEWTVYIYIAHINFSRQWETYTMMSLSIGHTH